MFAVRVRGTALIALFCATNTPVFGQTIVSGTVRVDKRSPLAGAVVGVRGSHLGATTNDAGRYSLQIPSADSVTLIARRIGFAPVTRRIAVDHRRTITVDFELKATAVSLDEAATTGVATDPGTPGVVKDREKSIVARREAGVSDSREARPAAASALAKSRSDGSRVGRGGAVNQEPRAGVLTAAVWDDTEHWSQYARFLGRAQENSWNPWGLEVGQRTLRPTRSARRPSPRRALDLGFLVDATGSMGDEMAFLQSELKDIVRRVRAVEPDLDVRLSVVFYRDRGDEFITKSLPFTRSADDAVRFIAGTSAGGGGDYPEDMNAGLEAIMRQRWSHDDVPQMLFLLADAPPQQYPGQDYTYHEAIQDAAAHGIAIYPVAASGVDKPTEFLFRAMAVLTGGKYVFLTDDSGVGNSHEVPDISGYTVEKLNDLMVREIRSYVSEHTLPRGIANR